MIVRERYVRSAKVLFEDTVFIQDMLGAMKKT
jgi:hypothetical protein